MLTYSLSFDSTTCLYEQLYDAIRMDIQNGELKNGDKLPSKRSLSANLGISVITVETAYALLCAEGYVISVPKSGFYVHSFLQDSIPRQHANEKSESSEWIPPKESSNSAIDANVKVYFADFISNRNESGSFPFTIWAKLMRETLSIDPNELLRKSPGCGIYALRNAISNHLTQFRGIKTMPEQIIVGAGTEYLYSLLIQLFGQDCVYGIENPGYQKIAQIYESNRIEYSPLPLDSDGIDPTALKQSKVNILHISPSHHFPTGLVTPINRRLELLTWANEKDDRYIIEDEYDSEFRLRGKPIQPMQSIDENEKVIYVNTFSKSLTDTIRISYMVLPPKLVDLFYQKLSFYSCTVPVFEQQVLARFISEGYFDKHINRMRNRNRTKRELLLNSLKSSKLMEYATVQEADAGLHLLLSLNSQIRIDGIAEAIAKQNLRVARVSDYVHNKKETGTEIAIATPTTAGNGTLQNTIILNYSEIESDLIPEAIYRLEQAILSCKLQ